MCQWREQGTTTLRQARDLFPDNYRITGSIADLYAYQAEYAKAEAELKKLIEKNQSSEVKQYGYNKLSDFYPYQGKYRKALNSIDNRIEILWEEKDTTRAASAGISKGFLYLWGWNDMDNAWKEAEKTFPFKNKITSLNYRGALSIMLTYHHDFAKAKALADSFPFKWLSQSVQSISYSLQKDEKNAEIFADSVLKGSNTDFIKMLVLYPLAECQYKKGQLNKALESIKKLQTIIIPWPRQIYYPKSFYLMGKIYEKKGDTSLAVKNYEKFLELWKDADQDLPDLIDAKKRLANLKGVS